MNLDALHSKLQDWEICSPAILGYELIENDIDDQETACRCLKATEASSSD